MKSYGGGFKEGDLFNKPSVQILGIIRSAIHSLKAEPLKKWLA
jgi:hypothetical protein